MSLTSTTPRQDIKGPQANRLRKTPLALPLVFLACFGLNACGSSSKSSSSATSAAATTSTTPPATITQTTPSTTTQTTPSATTEAANARAKLMTFVTCMRKHGIHMPEPDAHNNINLHGLHVKGHHYQTAGTACLAELQKTPATSSGPSKAP